MRLKCPNCDAQYEVPKDVMPLDGRDVQCSNCGQTWFQYHPDNLPEPQDDNDIPDEDEEIVRADDPAPSDAPDPGQNTSVDWPSRNEPPADKDENAEDAPDPAMVAPRRKELDPAVADILREEAELELTARQKQPSGPLETQPDLGLDDGSARDDADRRAREASERMSRMRGERVDDEDDAETVATEAALGSRRDLLPDIEEINSTLRSSTDRGTSDPTELANVEVRERRGFRRGFTTMVLIVALLVLLYVFAPRVAAAVPALEAPLTAYVDLVDGGRAWLDARLRSLLSWLDGAAASSGN
jgi:predicted Zn finger-like uncharacterized protein